MSREELEKWLSIYGKDIYSFCRKLTKDKTEADDLYQDTFLKMVELYDRLDIRQNPKSYLLSVAVNLWRNRKRKFSWRQRITGPCISLEELVMDIPSGKKSVEEQMISKEEKKLVCAAVDALPEKYKLHKLHRIFFPFLHCHSCHCLMYRFQKLLICSTIQLSLLYLCLIMRCKCIFTQMKTLHKEKFTTHTELQKI